MMRRHRMIRAMPPTQIAVLEFLFRVFERPNQMIPKIE